MLGLFRNQKQNSEPGITSLMSFNTDSELDSKSQKRSKMQTKARHGCRAGRQAAGVGTGRSEEEDREKLAFCWQQRTKQRYRGSVTFYRSVTDKLARTGVKSQLLSALLMS